MLWVHAGVQLGDFVGTDLYGLATTGTSLVSPRWDELVGLILVASGEGSWLPAPRHHRGDGATSATRSVPPTPHWGNAIGWALPKPRPPQTGEVPLVGLTPSPSHPELGKLHWPGSPQLPHQLGETSQVPPTPKQRTVIGWPLPNSHPPQIGEPPSVELFPTPTHPKKEKHHWSGSPQAPPLPNLGSRHHHPRTTPTDA